MNDKNVNCRFLACATFSLGKPVTLHSLLINSVLELTRCLLKESMKITELIWVQSYLILDQVSDKMCKFNISVDNFQLDLQTFTARANKGRRGQNTCILGLLQHYESQQKILSTPWEALVTSRIIRYMCCYLLCFYTLELMYYFCYLCTYVYLTWILNPIKGLLVANYPWLTSQDCSHRQAIIEMKKT